MNAIQHTQAELPNIFTPSAPVSDVRLLKGRDVVIDDINRAIARKGATIILYGERGVGKSSIAKIISQFVEGKPFYYSASSEDTFETICSTILQYYNTGWTPETRDIQSSRSCQGAIKIGSVNVGGAQSDTSEHHDSQIERSRLTAQQVAMRLPKDAKLVVIDEFERIKSHRDRAAFADLIKKLSDNESSTTLMLVGVAENINELLIAHESAQRSIYEVKVDRLKDEAIHGIVITGMEALGLEIEGTIADQIVMFSARFPYYTHLLCEGVVQALLNRCADEQAPLLRVVLEDLSSSILYAIRCAQNSIVQSYNEAVRSIQGSPRFKYCLYAMASWPQEPVAYGDISRWIGKLQRTPSNTVNISHQLKRLETSHVIKRVAPGYYAFRNPMLKAYVILKARVDTPDVELQAIDVQLEQVRKRFENVQQRLGSA